MLLWFTLKASAQTLTTTRIENTLELLRGSVTNRVNFYILNYEYI